MSEVLSDADPVEDMRRLKDDVHAIKVDVNDIKYNNQRPVVRDYMALAWSLFGIVAVAALAVVIVFVADATRKGDADRQRTQRDRIEACTKLPTPEQQTLCLSVVNK